MIFDTHCHYNLDPLSKNWQSHWLKAQQHGVQKALVAGTDLKSSAVATHIASQEDDLYASVGIHPHEYSDLTKKIKSLEALSEVASLDLELLAQNITERPKIVVAVGETGLDYFRLDSKDEQSRQAQQLGFMMQVEFAQEFKLPLIIHVRDKEAPEEPTEGNAYWDVLQILKESKFPQPFILHCVSGPINYIKEAVSLGAYIGVAGNVTYKSAKRIRKIVKLTPLDRLLIETDAPFLPPQKYRGQTCEPWMIVETAKYLKKELRVDLGQVWKNSNQIFKIT